jgi:uncharacterized membrane protein
MLALITSVTLVLICIYLSYRYHRIKARPNEIGSSFCSWTTYIDCDKVLSTKEAKFFIIPNAYLGLAFNSIGLALIIILQQSNSTWLMNTLIFMYTVSSMVTFIFWYLLLRLPNLCPLCPTHHVLTYSLLLSLKFQV